MVTLRTSPKVEIACVAKHTRNARHLWRLVTDTHAGYRWQNSQTPPYFGLSHFAHERSAFWYHGGPRRTRADRFCSTEGAHKSMEMTLNNRFNGIVGVRPAAETQKNEESPSLHAGLCTYRAHCRQLLDGTLSLGIHSTVAIVW